MTGVTHTDEGSEPRRTKPIRVAEVIRSWMVERGFRSGDRAPDVALFIQQFGMSRATIRNALAILEAQGFLEAETGVTEGWFVGSLTGERAQAILADYLVVSGLSVPDIYQIRRLLEPDLVAGLAGHMTGEALDELEEGLCPDTGEVPPGGSLDRQIGALAFHARLAREAGNPLLGVLVGCLARALSEIAASEEGEVPPVSVYLRKGQDYRRLLISALRDGDAREARRIMLDHLETALHHAEVEETEARPRLIAE